MRKADIATRIHQQAGISKKEAARVLDWIVALFKCTLESGEPIAIAGFGTFKARRKEARRGRNPRTGEAMMITARRVVTFHPSPIFKAAVNEAKQDSTEQ
jgi:integration host factor subunit alpha